MLEDSSPPMGAGVGPSPPYQEDAGIPVHHESGTPQPAAVVQQELRDLMVRILSCIRQEQTGDPLAQFLDISPLLALGDILLSLMGFSLLGNIPMEIISDRRERTEPSKRTVNELPVWAWRQVTFYPNTSEQRTVICAIQQLLARDGVCFDHGAVVGDTDAVTWHLDWSFKSLPRALEGLKDVVSDVRPEDH